MSDQIVIGDDTKVVRGVTLKNDPAREDCFDIVHTHGDVPDDEGADWNHFCQKLHREYNQEVQNLEVGAACIADFPESPWELRVELARQCWDEARHAQMFLRRLEEKGGWKGQFAIANLDWSVVLMLDSLPARLAVQHRTFEGGSLDLHEQAESIWEEAGEDATAAVYEVVGADEIPHVQFANYWLKRWGDEDPRSLLQVASAMTWLREVIRATGGTDMMHLIRTDTETRQLAGFNDDEITEVVRQEHQFEDLGLTLDHGLRERSDWPTP